MAAKEIIKSVTVGVDSTSKGISQAHRFVKIAFIPKPSAKKPIGNIANTSRYFAFSGPEDFKALLEEYVWNAGSVTEESTMLTEGLDPQHETEIEGILAWLKDLLVSRSNLIRDVKQVMRSKKSVLIKLCQKDPFLSKNFNLDDPGEVDDAGRASFTERFVTLLDEIPELSAFQKQNREWFMKTIQRSLPSEWQRLLSLEDLPPSSDTPESEASATPSETESSPPPVLEEAMPSPQQVPPEAVAVTPSAQTDSAAERDASNEPSADNEESEPAERESTTA